MRSGHLVAPLVLLGVLAAVAPSCVDAGERVAVLGDSITSLDTEDLEADLGEEYRFDISGNFGMTTDQVRPEVEVLSQRTFDQVIINLGTNDVLQGDPPQHAVDVIAQYVAMFDSARCLHVVTVNEHMENQRNGQSTAEGSKQFNEALRAFAESQERVTVIDWNAVTAQNLDSSEPPTSTLTSDSIHPTPEGNHALNSLYADALGDWEQVL